LDLLSETNPTRRIGFACASHPTRRIGFVVGLVSLARQIRFRLRLSETIPQRRIWGASGTNPTRRIGFACALVWLLGSVFGLRSSVLIGPWDPWTHGPLDHWTLGPVDPLDPKSLDPKSLDPPACSELGLTPSAFAMDASVDGKYSTPAEPNVGGVLCLIN